MVLNVQDEIINGTPKYNITSNGDGTSNIELANEVLQEGTPLNKALFDEIGKLNAIDIYNDVTGEYNPTTQTIELEVNTDTRNIVNNKRILISPTQNVMAPATSVDTIKSKTQLKTGCQYSDFVELNNGNILVAFNYGEQGYYIIIDKNGTILKDTTTISSSNLSNIHTLKLSNGNVLIYGFSTDNYYGNYSIVNQSGNYVKNPTTLPNGTWGYVKAIELSNGKILFAGTNTASTPFYMITDLSGTIILNPVNIGGTGDPTPIELNNGNILISYSTYFKIVNTSGTTIVGQTNLGGSYRYRPIKLNNGNILLYAYQYTLNIVIVNQSGEIVYSKLDAGTGHQYVRGHLVLSNGNIIIASYEDSNSVAGYITILNQSGGIVKSDTKIGDYYYMYRNQISTMIEMDNGNLFFIGNSKSNAYTYISILTKNGDVVYNQTSIGSSWWNTNCKQLSDGNIIVIGGHSNLDFYIGKPVATSTNETLNGIQLDTMLLKDKYYELVYNESQNKFIVEEVRNAN